MSNSWRPHGLQHAGFPIHHQLLELAQTLVHRVSDAIQPSYPLLSPSPPYVSVGLKCTELLGAFEGNGIPLQYSCLENSMDGGAWWATVHAVTKSWTRLSDFRMTKYQLYQISGKTT